MSPFFSLLWFGCLSPFFSLLSFLRKGVLFHHGFPGSSSFWQGFWCLSPFFSLLWFRCLSPFFSLLSFLRKGVLFHHDLLVPPGSGLGSGACLLSSLFFGSGACPPSSLFFLVSGKRFCSIMICWFLFVLARVLVLVSLLSSFFSQERVSVPSKNYWFLPLAAGVSVLVSLLLAFFPLREGFCPHLDLLVPPSSGWGSGACLPSSLVFLFSEKGFCSFMDFLVPPASGWGSGACLPSSLFFLYSTGVWQTTP